MQCKTSCIPLVLKAGPATISRSSIKLCPSISIYCVRFISIISFNSLIYLI